MPCSVCKDAISLGNDAVHESLDNFQRFYYNDVFKDSDQIEKHVYQYNSIADNFTRVLELKSGSADEPIICSLSELCIDGPEKYEALSYTWGSPRRSKTIKVDSTDFLVRFVREVMRLAKQLIGNR
jgi:hypothetical protein